MTSERTDPKTLPDWYPEWAQEFAELYFSGTTNTFILHGNTHDPVSAKKSFVTLSQFIAQHLFGQWDIVLYYDLSTGLRVTAGSDGERQRTMAATVAKAIGDLTPIGKDPSRVLHVLDRFIQKNVMAESKDRLSVALIINHASFVASRNDRSLKAATHLVTLLNWAASPYVKRLNTAICLIDTTLGDMSERLVDNPHIASLDVPMPDWGARLKYISSLTDWNDHEAVLKFSNYSEHQIAELTAGMSLTDLRVLVEGSIASGRRLDEARFKELKKTLIERQAGGLLEFLDPKWGLDMVVGHEAAKKRLKEDASLLAQGRLQSVPMGYLLCGPVGTGKSFLAECAAGEMGIPAVKLKNFRGGLVGQTESNLEHVLGILRSMGPVMVIVDEADAQLGSRKSSGDSGTSGRVFGMIAQQMGDTKYRGKILWMLMTARPDYLPIDIKRQGRAEVHIPLFYPTEKKELEQMFMVLARKLGTEIPLGPAVPEDKLGQLSGADIEGILGRSWRNALVKGEDHIDMDDLNACVERFIPMAQSQERLLQKYAAIIECTDEEFLPPTVRQDIEMIGGRSKIQQHLNALKHAVDGT